MWAMPDFHVCKIKALDFAAIANHILEIFGHAMPVEIWKYAVELQGICDLSILHVTFAKKKRKIVQMSKKCKRKLPQFRFELSLVQQVQDINLPLFLVPHC